MTVFVRPATIEDAGVLTDICKRSKAHWGYPRAYLDLWAGELTITEQKIAEYQTYCALDADGDIIGFGMLCADTPTGEIENLYVCPSAMGSGVGRLLMDTLKSAARNAGCTHLELDSDPHALGFYERMGAVKVGGTPSTAIPGRTLPRARITI